MWRENNSRQQIRLRRACKANDEANVVEPAPPKGGGPLVVCFFQYGVFDWWSELPGYWRVTD